MLLLKSDEEIGRIVLMAIIDSWTEMGQIQLELKIINSINKFNRV